MNRWLRRGSVRLVAALLTLLTASPLTAPFTTCDWTSLITRSSAGAIRVVLPASIVHDTKTPSDPNTTTVVPIARTIIPARDLPSGADPIGAPPAVASQRSAVLRV